MTAAEEPDMEHVERAFHEGYRAALITARGGVLPGPFYDYLTGLIEDGEGLCRQEFVYRHHLVPYICVLTKGHKGPHQCSFSDGVVYQSAAAPDPREREG